MASIFELTVDEEYVYEATFSMDYGDDDLCNHERFADIIGKVMEDGAKKGDDGWTDFHDYMYFERSREYEMLCDLLIDCVRGYVEKKANELLNGEE